MPRVQVEKQVGPTKREVLKGLHAFNLKTKGRQRYKQFAVSVRDDAGAIVGGVIGNVWGNFLFVMSVWLDERFRDKDLMTAAMDELEAAAKAFGASHAYVDTLTFQARPFYEKRGYHLFGRLEGFLDGEDRFWLMKALA